MTKQIEDCENRNKTRWFTKIDIFNRFNINLKKCIRKNVTNKKVVNLGYKNKNKQSTNGSLKNLKRSKAKKETKQQYIKLYKWTFEN